MKRFLFVLSFIICHLLFSVAYANQRTIDISGNNTSSNYISYNKSTRISANDTVDVMMARYCYFSSEIVIVTSPCPSSPVISSADRSTCPSFV